MKLLLDNSALSLLPCKRRFQLAVVDGLKGHTSASAQFGSAFHTAIEYLDKNLGVDESVDKTFEKYPDVNKLLLMQTVALFRTTKKLPPPIILDDGKPAVEIKFSFPYNHGEQDIELCGTIDRIHLDEEKDILVILDYKTAGDVTDYKIAAKLDSYSLSFQLPFYVFCLLNSGILPARYKDYLVNGRYRVELLIVFYAAQPPRFKTLSKQAFNSDFITREVPLIIETRAKEAMDIVALGSSPAPHDGMNIYKYCDYCDFRNACLVMGSEREVELLSRFEKKTYNPMEFR